MGLPNSGWRGSLNLLDVVRGGRRPNDGALINGPTWSVAPNGLPAILFSGGSDYCQSARTFGLSGAYQRTTSCYVKILAWPSNGGILRMGCDAGTNGDDYSIETRGSAGSAAFNGFFADYTFTLPSDGAWMQIVTTYDGSNSITYANGYSVGSASISLNTFDVGVTFGSTRLASDRSVNHGGSFVNMYMAGATLHTRCLSASEVAALYAQTRRGYPDLLRWLPTRAWSIPQGAPPPSGQISPAVYRMNTNKVIKGLI
jgi:hypothetical protein